MNINFSCIKSLSGVIPQPVPAVKMTPDYFRKIKPQMSNHPESGTAKRCVPFLDALSAGFIIPLWADMHVFAKDENININFPQNFPQGESLGTHSEQQLPGHPLSNLPYGKLLMKFINPWVIETEQGVSCLFTSPLNHFQRHFKIIDGVVDTDSYYNNINFPFLWTGGDGDFFFKKGTPLVQVIPFRRESITATFLETDNDRVNKTCAALGTKMRNGYRDEFWHNKKLNLEEKDLVQDVVSESKEFPVHEEKISQVQDPVSQTEWKTRPSSGILEVVANDKDRGFGEGGF